MANDEWETPPALFAALDAEFHFDLDAAATDTNAKCVAHFTRANSALTQPWATHGKRVFCNPPYSRPNLDAFLAKAYIESREDCEVVVLLVKADTSTRWWHRWVMQAEEVRVLKGRVNHYIRGEPAPKSSNRFDSAIVIFDRSRRVPVLTTMDVPK